MTASAGVPAPFPPEQAARLSDSLEADLRRHVLDAWFPRCVDRERGGFRSKFDRRWQPAARQPRMLEFQARQTRLLAQLARAYPDDGRWAAWALHGFAYLRDRLWDHEHGGWYWLADEEGRPQHAATKHAHGSAYAIGACAAVYSATGEERALELALEGFEWIERFHHDREHGGYHGWVTREGRAIRTLAEAPDGLREPLSAPPHHKNVNVHCDLAEALAALSRVRPDPRVRDRAGYALDVLESRFLLADGSLHYSLTADWQPLPQLERFGYHLQLAARVFAGPGVPGDASDPAAVAERTVRHVLERAWRGRGGFAYAAPAVPPDGLERHSLVVPRRMWWVQAEGLRALLSLAYARPSEGTYRLRFLNLLEFVRRELLDDRYGGWFPMPRRDGSARERLRRRWPAKGDVWMDASHQGETYLECVRLLRGAGEGSPLEAGER